MDTAMRVLNMRPTSLANQEKRMKALMQRVDWVSGGLEEVESCLRKSCDTY